MGTNKYNHFVDSSSVIQELRCFKTAAVVYWQALKRYPGILSINSTYTKTCDRGAAFAVLVEFMRNMRSIAEEP